jgi:hypothetical protein
MHVRRIGVEIKNPNSSVENHKVRIKWKKTEKYAHWEGKWSWLGNHKA